jgi:hypothetical protein
MATSTDLRAAIDEVRNQLPEPGAEGLVEREEDFASRIEQRVGALPWWVISAVVHAVLFLLITLLAVALPRPEQDEVIISTDVAKEKPPEYDEKKQRDIFKNPNEIQHETKVENPVLVHEQVEITDHFETDNNMDSQTARGNEDAISDIPLGGTGVSGSIGVGGGGMAGCFGYRDGGGRKHAVARFGGSPATESAVEAALQWLARHQEADGCWTPSKWESRVEGGDVRVRVGTTGLALLAFLGAGYTDKSGKFADNVRRAQNWLISQQKPNGGIFEKGDNGYHTSEGYNHAVAALALAEAYGMTRDARIGEAAQKAVDYSVNVHQEPYSGWRYNAKKGADLSVTGWFVMQLKSAKIAGLKVDSAGFQGAQAYLGRVSTPDGRAGYTDRNAKPAMTAVAMVCRQFMGTPNTDPLLDGGSAYIVKYLPAWKGDGGGNWHAVESEARNHEGTTFYYWYYGTLAMFQQGGDAWNRWNAALKPVLIDNQCKGGPLDGSAADKDGSWDPIGTIDVMGGRAYTTAVGALCLEVYYRYLPMYTK